MVCREPRSILNLEEILQQKSMHITILTRRSRRAFLTSLEQHLMFLDTNYPVEKKVLRTGRAHFVVWGRKRNKYSFCLIDFSCPLQACEQKIAGGTRSQRAD